MPNTEGSNAMLVPVSVGELFDKITILEIKGARIADETKQVNVTKELAALNAIVGKSLELSDEGLGIVAELRDVNGQLWDIEDKIRDCERHKDFGSHFVELARSVYRMNDQRTGLKKRLNELTGSALVEEKSYSDYET